MKEAETILDLEETMTDIQGWLNSVKLKLNPDKTEFIMFGNGVQLKKCLTNYLQVVNDTIKVREIRLHTISWRLPR